VGISANASVTRSVFTIVAIVFIMGAQSVSAVLGPHDCVDFEDLTPTTVYNVGDFFDDSGVTVTMGDFQWAGGTWTSGGFTRVETTNLAGSLGNEMQVNNITLDFNFGRIVEDMSIRFAELGGNINLTINGDFRNETDILDLDDQLIGGTLVKVFFDATTDRGILVINGDVTSFSIGGQELWIDDVCENPPSADCVDFEEQPYPQDYGFGQFFVDSGVAIELGEFFWFGGGSTTSGSCSIDNQQISGGTGQDANSNNINLHFDFNTSYERLDLLYTDLGGNINVWVDGAMANVENVTDLNLTTLGGVTILVQPATGNSGQLIALGHIDSFGIGGQELWVDNVCISGRPLFSDGFEFGNTSGWDQTVP